MKKESQKDRFIKTARDLECDESEDKFAAKLKAIASVKPEKKEEE